MRTWLGVAAATTTALVSSSLAGADDLAIGVPMCEATLELESYETGETCWVDAPPRGSRATAVYPCRGGKTRFTYGRHAFRGKVKKNRLDAKATTTFEWQDGCTWQGDHAITGSLASGDLVYDYREHVIKSDGSCMPPCVARGRVVVVHEEE
jgi:hypothetical protein